jgi:hypothetical protein
MLVGRLVGDHLLLELWILSEIYKYCVVITDATVKAFKGLWALSDNI